MPVREIKTTIALDGEQEFKREIAGAAKEMSALNAELRAVASAYDLSGDKMQGLTDKQGILRQQIEQQESIINAHKDRLRQWGEEYERLGNAIEEARQKLDQAKSTGDDVAIKKYTAEVTRLENAYDNAARQVTKYRIETANAENKGNTLKKTSADLDREIEELGRDSIKAGRQIEQGIGESSQEAEKDVRGLVETLQDDLSAIRTNTTFTAIGSLWDMAAGAYTSVAGFVESTAEYRKNLSLLETTASIYDFDFETIEEQLKNVQALTGDASTAIDGLRSLIAADIDEGRIDTITKGLMGATILYQGLDFASLASDLEKTLAKEQAVGSMEDLLNSMGVNVEEFNNALEKSPTKVGDIDIVAAMLAAGGLEQVYQKWVEINGQEDKAGRVQADLEKELAEFGGTLEDYIVTPVKELLVEALTWVNDTIEKEEQKWAKWKENGGITPQEYVKRIEGIKNTQGQKAAESAVIEDFERGSEVIVNAAKKEAATWWENFTNPQLFYETFHAPLIKLFTGEEPPAIDFSKSPMESPEGFYQKVHKPFEDAMDGASGDIINLLIPTASAEEAGADAADAYYDGFANQINAREDETEQAQSPVKMTGLPTEGDLEEIIRTIDAELQEAQPELQEAGEEAGDAMGSGFEEAWEALENKAYLAGAGAGAAYAEGLNSQLGAISAAAARLSAVASAGLERASRLARLGITINLDGRKVAEGIAPYTDETMATYLNVD